MATPIDIVPVLNYYDAIAVRYNDFMTDSDARMRLMVSREFKSRVKGGNVMDFGGGTGLDLPWLLKEPYQVFFLEQSDNMRQVAENSVTTTDKRPFFIHNNVRFPEWGPAHLPCAEKMNGILANFAVFNCIENIDMLFEKLSLVCDKGCHIVAAVLDSRLKTIFKKYSFNTKMAALFARKAVLYNNYKGIGHSTWLHTARQYRAASEKYFNFITYTPLADSDFALLILSRK